MHNQQFRSEWASIRRAIRSRWPSIEEDDVNQIAGRPERLFHAIVKRTGVSHGVAAQQLHDFLKTFRPQRGDTCCAGAAR